MDRKFRHQLTASMGQIQRCLIEFYSWRARRSSADVLRHMVLQYARADKSLDPNAFLEFVQMHMLPNAQKEDEELGEEIMRQVKVFCESHPEFDKSALGKTRKKKPAAKQPKKKSRDLSQN